MQCCTFCGLHPPLVYWRGKLGFCDDWCALAYDLERLAKKDVA